ncbi:hypothetical protein SO694_00105017 [Aureococcus anophagefferens]|uniref:Uncharacterized protein n=1 Tax=Aureococcus anophagefferens TaxID=44056 RepID=A0ABR1FM94_AURAN
MSSSDHTQAGNLRPRPQPLAAARPLGAAAALDVAGDAPAATRRPGRRRGHGQALLRRGGRHAKDGEQLGVYVVKLAREQVETLSLSSVKQIIRNAVGERFEGFVAAKTKKVLLVLDGVDHEFSPGKNGGLSFLLSEALYCDRAAGGPPCFEAHLVLTKAQVNAALESATISVGRRAAKLVFKADVHKLSSPNNLNKVIQHTAIHLKQAQDAKEVVPVGDADGVRDARRRRSTASSALTLKKQATTLEPPRRRYHARRRGPRPQVRIADLP